MIKVLRVDDRLLHGQVAVAWTNFYKVDTIVVANAREEKFKKAKVAGVECDEESINAVKTALMGPLAGIGDSFFWGTFH